MNEDLIHFIWQYQKFDKKYLTTTSGQKLSILKPGTPHTDAGPDFQNARIQLDELQWAGQVEIHEKSSDWKKHFHHKDEAYDNIILHVVWENDKELLRNNGTPIPTLELSKRVNESLLSKYQYFKESQTAIPCEKHFRQQSRISKYSMIEKAFAQRMERKSKEILIQYENLGHDFNELAYQRLFMNFGFKLNNEPFYILSRNLPSKILSKHQGNLFQIEALLFGMSGLLKEPSDEYAQNLYEEYQFLAKKYQLGSFELQKSDWKFLRTRPQNFPTVRLAQLAGILNNNTHFFNLFLEKNEQSLNFLTPSLSPYWTEHYQWNKKSVKPNKLGLDSLNNILINTIAPLLTSYYYISGEYKYFEKAIEILENLPSEQNFITKIWDSLNLKSKSAYESQALIEQYNEFCTKRKCLQCAVGIEILKT